jgi:hypothetical protein
VREHLDGILAFIHSGLTNARLEDLNKQDPSPQPPGLRLPLRRSPLATIYLCCSGIVLPQLHLIQENLQRSPVLTLFDATAKRASTTTMAEALGRGHAPGAIGGAQPKWSAAAGPQDAPHRLASARTKSPRNRERPRGRAPCRGPTTKEVDPTPYFTALIMSKIGRYIAAARPGRQPSRRADRQLPLSIVPPS